MWLGDMVVKALAIGDHGFSPSHCTLECVLGQVVDARTHTHTHTDCITNQAVPV